MAARDAISFIASEARGIRTANLTIGLTNTTNTPYTFPPSAGNENDILVLNSVNQLTWASESSIGVTSISGTSGQIVTDPSPGVGAVTVSIPDTLQLNANLVTNVETQGPTTQTTAIGYQALHNLTDDFNTSQLIAIGKQSLYNFVDAGAADLIAIGNDNCFNLNSSANYNLVIGNQTLSDPHNTACTNTVVVGSYSAQNLSSGTQNILLGNDTLTQSKSTNDTNTQYNIFVGNSSLNDVGNNSMSRNIILGHQIPAAQISGNGYSGCFIVDPYHITYMNVGGIIYGTQTRVVVPNNKQIWQTTPSSNNSFLTCDTNNNITWQAGPSFSDTITLPWTNVSTSTNLTFVSTKLTSTLGTKSIVISTGGIEFAPTAGSGSTNIWTSPILPGGARYASSSGTVTTYLGNSPFQNLVSNVFGYAYFYLQQSEVTQNCVLIVEFLNPDFTAYNLASYNQYGFGASQFSGILNGSVSFTYI